ncbi:hypothetical protein HB777_39490 (plasmid) [Mesorhizobium loti]|nr:hypothetical protein HB777_39490 [Mesorhizobium loti]
MRAGVRNEARVSGDDPRAVTIIGKRLSPILSTLEKAGRVGLNREGDWAEDRIDRRPI